MGYIPFLGTKPAEKIFDLSKIYGNVFSLYIGSRLTVVLNDYDAIKQAYNDNADVFVDRQPGFAHRALNGATNGPLTGGNYPVMLEFPKEYRQYLFANCR